MTDFLVVETGIEYSSPDEGSHAGGLFSLSDGRYASFWIDQRIDRLTLSQTQVSLQLRVFSGIWGDEGTTFEIAPPPFAAGWVKILDMFELADGALALVFERNGTVWLHSYSTEAAPLSGFAAGNAFWPGADFAFSHAVPLSDGNILVVQANAANPSVAGAQLWGEIYDAQGARLAVPFLLAGRTEVAFQGAETIELADGGFLTVWAQYSNPADEFSPRVVMGSIVNANGTSRAVPFAISAVPTLDSTIPSVAQLRNGNIVVSWSQADPTNPEIRDRYDCLAQIIDPAGTAVGSNFSVSPWLAGMQTASEVSALADGNFLMTWSESQDDIVGQLFTPDGSYAGAAFLLTPGNTNQIWAHGASVLSDGRVILNWKQDTTGFQDSLWLSEIDPRLTGVTLTGRAGSDNFCGTIYDDRLDGLAGNDTLYGWAGRDTVNGGSGEDLVYGASGNDIVIGGNGRDSVYGGDGNDMLGGGEGNDQLEGGAGNDYLNGANYDAVFDPMSA